MRRFSGTTQPDEAVRRDAFLTQIWASFASVPDSGRQLRVLGACDAWPVMCSRNPLVGSHVAMYQRPVTYVAIYGHRKSCLAYVPCQAMQDHGRPISGQLINCHDLLWLWLGHIWLWFSYVVHIATKDQGAYGSGRQDESSCWERWLSWPNWYGPRSKLYPSLDANGSERIVCVTGLGRRPIEDA
jgi:hypothetical protein